VGSRHPAPRIATQIRRVLTERRQLSGGALCALACRVSWNARARTDRDGASLNYIESVVLSPSSTAVHPARTDSGCHQEPQRLPGTTRACQFWRPPRASAHEGLSLRSEPVSRIEWCMPQAAHRKNGDCRGIATTLYFAETFGITPAVSGETPPCSLRRSRHARICSNNAACPKRAMRRRKIRPCHRLQRQATGYSRAPSRMMRSR